MAHTFRLGGLRLDIVNVPKNIVKYITGNNICMVSALIHTLICTEVNCLFASVSSAVMCWHTHKYDDTVYTVIIFYMQYIYNEFLSNSAKSKDYETCLPLHRLPCATSKVSSKKH